MELTLLLQYPQLTASDWRTLAASMLLGPDAYREEIAELAGIHPVTVSRCLVKLNEAGLIITNRTYTRETGKTRFTNTPINVTERLHCPPINVTERLHCPPENGQNGAKSGAMLPNGYTMNHDDDDIKNELNFLDSAGLEKLLHLPHLTLEFAQAWRRHKDWRDADGWNGIKNPPGYIYKEMHKGNWPTVQQELPGGVMEFSPEQLEQINPALVMAGATLGKDGRWR